MLHKQNFPSGKQDPPEIQRSSAEKIHLRGDGATEGCPVGNACTPVDPSPAPTTRKVHVDRHRLTQAALVPGCSDDVKQRCFFDIIQAKQHRLIG